MSIFGSILSALHLNSTPAAPEPLVSEIPEADKSEGGPAATAQTVAVLSSNDTGSGAAPIDVAAIMDKLSAGSDEDLDWRRSIVDLMKLLKLDSGLAARKKLAAELAYSGDMHDSAKMNVWLHGKVMEQLAANGGIVPDNLKKA